MLLKVKKLIMSFSSIKIASEEDTLQFLKSTYGGQKRKKKIYAFYSSQFNQIITDESYMVIPIDERIATRAHGVFDVIYIKKLEMINIDWHLSRLFKSASSVVIDPPVSQKQMKEIINEIMHQLIRKMRKDGMAIEKLLEMVFVVRVSISSGYGDFGIASIDKKPVFYITVSEPTFNYVQEKEGVNEFVVKIEKEQNRLVHSKTVNYIDNALMANQSKIRGGYQGIKATENGVLLQASVANIAFIFGKEFATPRLETVIEGTTLKKLLKFVEELRSEGKIEKISFRDITVEEAQSKATQMMVIGGDKIVPVLNFNGKKISQKKGEFASLFQQWYQKQNQTNLSILIDEQL